MRARNGTAEVGVEPVEHEFRQPVRQLRRLAIGGGPVQSEHVGEPPLDDAVPAHDGRGRHGTHLRELDRMVGAHPHPAVSDQPLQTDGCRRRAHPEPFGQAPWPRDLTLVLDVVDRLQVPLDGE